MKKILFVASTSSHILNFHLPYIQYFNELGWEVHVIVNRREHIPYSNKVYVLDITKKMVSKNNIKVVYELSKIISKEKYDVISMHTTLAAFVTRLAIIKCRRKTCKVINTVHGFLFCPEQSFVKNFIYFMMEIILAPFTDKIITMNEYDYQMAEKYLKCKDGVYSIPGMGIDEKKRNTIKVKQEKHQERITILCSAEFSDRKNQIFVIRVLEKVVYKWPQIYVIFLGSGKRLERCKKEVDKLRINNNVIFLGHVTNPYEYLAVSDIVVSASISEGLPFNIMEAMNQGLPILASRVKGHTDLIEEGINGYLFDLKSQEEFINKLELLCSSSDIRKRQGKENKNKVRQYYIEEVFPQVIQHYKDYINDDKE